MVQNKDKFMVVRIDEYIFVKQINARTVNIYFAKDVVEGNFENASEVDCFTYGFHLTDRQIGSFNRMTQMCERYIKDKKEDR